LRSAVWAFCFSGRIMRMLDCTYLLEILRRYYPDRESRLAGRQRFDSEYWDIVRFFGDRGLRPDRVEIVCFGEQWRHKDPLVEGFAFGIAGRLRAEGRLHDGPLTMAVCQASWDARPPRLVVCPAHYEDLAGTCFALDLPDDRFGPEARSLREYYLSRQQTRDYGSSLLCAGLGVCGMLMIGQRGYRQVLTVRRCGHLASLEDSWGPAAAGAVDWRTDCATLEELAVKSLTNEVQEELGLRSDEVTITPLAMAREICRGDKPQVFCLITTDLALEEITRRLTARMQSGGEFDRWRWLPIDAGSTALEDSGVELNHEARMNIGLLEEYLVPHP